MGDPAVGALGYVVGALELVDQALEQGISSSLLHVVIPGSMGPTEAGFLCVLSIQNDDCLLKTTVLC